MIFPEGLKTVEDFALVAKELKSYSEGKVYLLGNMTEFGKTPYIHISEFEKMGYDVVIYPVSTLRIAMKAVDVFLGELLENGGVEPSLGNMMTRKQLYEKLQYTPGEEWIFPKPTSGGGGDKQEPEK